MADIVLGSLVGIAVYLIIVGVGNHLVDRRAPNLWDLWNMIVLGLGVLFVGGGAGVLFGTIDASLPAVF